MSQSAAAARGGAKESDPLVPGKRPPRGVRNAVPRLEQLSWAAAGPKVASAALLSWLVFVLTGLVFLGCYRPLPGAVLVCAALSAAGFLGLAATNYMRGDSDRCYTFALCALAVALGSLTGVCAYYGHALDYWDFNDHRHYSNVWPDELAAAHRDAGAIVFAEGTKPDRRAAAAYHVGSRTYCVAPITMRGFKTTTPDVQYWAAGVDCCSGKANFACGDVDNPSARAGLVIREHRYPALLRAVLAGEVENYMQATRMADAKFGIRSTAEPIFVRWAHDLDKARGTFLGDAWLFWFQAGLACIPISLLLGLGTPELTRDFRRAVQEAKDSGRRRPAV